jgi:hypothetical protein
MRKRLYWSVALVLGLATTLSAYQVLTNLKIDAEGTGNVVTIPFQLFEWGGVCENGIPYNPQWNYKTAEGPTPICVEGTNLTFGTASFDDATDQNLQTNFRLPADWSGSLDLVLLWRTAATSGNVVWQIFTVCRADDETIDPSFNAAQTITDAAGANASRFNTASLSSVTTTGCAANETLFLKIFRDGGHASDTIANSAQLVSFRLTYRRAM